MADWIKLPIDLLILITTLLVSLKDFSAFRSVCTSWRSAAPKEKFNTSKQHALPWLMISEPDPNFTKFYSLSRQKTCDFSVPHVQDCMIRARWFVFSSLGWIMRVAIDSSNVTLFHPLLGTKIQLPKERSLSYNTCKFVLSASPSLTSDYVVCVLHSFPSMSICGYYSIDFWKSGNSKWTRICKRDSIFFEDVAFYKGRFYAVDPHFRVFVLNVDQSCFDVRMVPQVAQNIGDDIHPLKVSKYLVESEESLLLVGFIRVGRRSSCRVMVHEVNLSNGTSAMVKSLGDMSLFLGESSSSFSVKVSDYSAGPCEANCICITDFSSKGCRIFTIRDKDSGIFHLKRDNPHMAGLWVQPTFF